MSYFYLTTFCFVLFSFYTYAIVKAPNDVEPYNPEPYSAENLAVLSNKMVIKH